MLDNLIVVPSLQHLLQSLLGVFVHVKLESANVGLRKVGRFLRHCFTLEVHLS